MELTLIIGIGISSFLILYFAFKLEDKHYILRFLSIFFFLGLFVLMAKTSLDYKDNCDFVIVNQTVTGNTTTLEYDYLCETNANTTAVTYYKSTLWYLRLFFIYVFIYFVYEVLQWKGVLRK